MILRRPLKIVTFQEAPSEMEAPGTGLPPLAKIRGAAPGINRVTACPLLCVYKYTDRVDLALHVF